MATIIIGNNTFDGCEITQNGNKILIDGKEIDLNNELQINIVVNGDIDKIKLTRSNNVEVNGDVRDLKITSGDIKINGDVCGSVQLTSGKINCSNIKGDATVVSGGIIY